MSKKGVSTEGQARVVRAGKNEERLEMENKFQERLASAGRPATDESQIASAHAGSKSGKRPNRIQARKTTGVAKKISGLMNLLAPNQVKALVRDETHRMR
jgi:hypothetical protein